MHAAADRPEFEPPKPPGFLKALALALLAHALLLVGLTGVVKWNRDAENVAAEAELWAAVPQEAAPKEVVTAPPAPPPPPPAAKEEPKPEPKPNEADIAAEREKKKREQERREAREEEEERKKKLAQKRKQEEQDKLAEKRKLEEEKKRKEKAQEQRLAKLREENLARMRNLAGGSGAPTSAGTAAQSSGPSSSWAGRVRARVKPNIVFADDVQGNPEALVAVRLAPDGTIVSKRIVKSSGNTAWDNAVLRALDKTEVLPRDVDGRVPASVDLAFRPKD